MTKNIYFNKTVAFILKSVGQVVHAFNPHCECQAPPDYTGQAANDYILHRLNTTHGGLMISKFGTYELKAFVNFYGREIGLRKTDVCNMLHYRYAMFRNPNHSMYRLSNNAGFFPCNPSLGGRYAKLVAEDWKEIDIMGSYQKAEAYPQSLLPEGTRPIRVDPDGYFAPFLWHNPWSSWLRDKRVLVVHPFTSSIRHQYARREELFKNPEVLPPFKELHTVKAVQGIAGNPTGYADWFQALEKMKEEMDKLNYDVALIGCGAYGMHLAAHAKRQGKVAIHLASMTQMLFGIYGERWIENPEMKPYILPSWIRPNKDETPAGAQKIENGCYW